MKEEVLESYNMADHISIHIIGYGMIMFRACIVRFGVCLYRSPMYISTLEAYNKTYNELVESREHNRNSK